MAGPAVVAGCGSSPLARGTLCLNHSPVLCGRLIPARAGNTTTSATTSTAAAAHPRSRGEHVFLAAAIVNRRGSSPLARGTHDGGRGLSVTDRLIPARAGNTDGFHGGHKSVMAHPRSRGEHTRLSAGNTSSPGSSPLARGTPPPPPRRLRRPRLIPARAGNTCWGCVLALRYSAHPRSRGEHGRQGDPGKSKFGSSPLARGTHS